jgi:gamma-glutamyl-gamma-aminobutyrate hydrolase PuuD
LARRATSRRLPVYIICRGIVAISRALQEIIVAICSWRSSASARWPAS